MAEESNPPSGCAWCGVGEREHAQRWTLLAGWHGWAAPNQALIKERMLARRNGRTLRSQADPDAWWEDATCLARKQQEDVLGMETLLSPLLTPKGDGHA